MKYKQFFEYCKDFYSFDGGIYPIATNEMINRAVILRMKSKHYEGDSIDRENTRLIIESLKTIEEVSQ